MTTPLDYVNTAIQALLLAGLVWYAVETRRIRIASQSQFALSQDQLEATRRPYVVLSTTARNREDAILAINGTDSTVMVFCPERLVQIENIGPGIAANIRYEFVPLDPVVQARPAGYVAHISQGGKFQLPVATGTIAGYAFRCVFSYESASHRRYLTTTLLNNLVITDIRFDPEPQPAQTNES